MLTLSFHVIILILCCTLRWEITKFHIENKGICDTYEMIKKNIHLFSSEKKNVKSEKLEMVYKCSQTFQIFIICWDFRPHGHVKGMKVSVFISKIIVFRTIL